MDPLKHVLFIKSNFLSTIQYTSNWENICKSLHIFCLFRFFRKLRFPRGVKDMIFNFSTETIYCAHCLFTSNVNFICNLNHPLEPWPSTILLYSITNQRTRPKALSCWHVITHMRCRNPHQHWKAVLHFLWHLVLKEMKKLFFKKMLKTM
jgi:hypothetical protein